MKLKPINTKYSTQMNKAYKHLRAYYSLVDLDGTFDTEKQEDKNLLKQEDKYELYLEQYNDLPGREQIAFDKQHKTIHGYV